MVLAISPMFIMFDSIKAEVGFWFSDQSSMDTSEAQDEGILEENTQKKDGGSVIQTLDRDQDGLVDYLETGLYMTDPLDTDTDKDGFKDGEEVKAGYDPKSHFKSKIDLDDDMLPDSLEIDKIGTDPNNADTDSDGVKDGEEVTSGTDPKSDKVARINPDLYEYRLKIPKINTDAPIIFTETKDESEIYEALKHGYAHYANTAIPPETGTTVIFCHSSGRFGSKGEYDTLCAKVDELERGDVFTLEGGNTKFEYRVTSVKNDYDPADPKIFRKTNRPNLDIISCYPVGTNHKRIVVRSEMVQK
ncbi:MAG: sortase family protein [uncultured bacterium]|nr:MAG: sortase family protein [uncultured bacterium]